LFTCNTLLWLSSDLLCCVCSGSSEHLTVSDVVVHSNHITAAAFLAPGIRGENVTFMVDWGAQQALQAMGTPYWWPASYPAAASDPHHKQAQLLLPAILVPLVVVVLFAAVAAAWLFVRRRRQQRQAAVDPSRKPLRFVGQQQQQQQQQQQAAAVRWAAAASRCGPLGSSSSSKPLRSVGQAAAPGGTAGSAADGTVLDAAPVGDRHSNGVRRSDVCVAVGKLQGPDPSSGSNGNHQSGYTQGQLAPPEDDGGARSHGSKQQWLCC
jgi:hypothetical protein